MAFRRLYAAFTIALICVQSPLAVAGGKKRQKEPTRGEVAAAETAKIASQLSKPGDPIWFPEMLSWMAARAKEPFVTGNHLELLQDGTEFFNRRLEMIRRARRSIDVTTFLWCDDYAGIAVANELARAARRGVRVRVLISFFNTKEFARAEATLNNSGIQILTVNPPFWGLDLIQDVNHEKIMVVDGRESLVGGANLCDEYMVGGGKAGLWREMEVYTSGPLNAKIQRRLDDTWNIMATTESDVNCGYDSVMRDTSPGSGFRCRPAKYRRYSDPTPVETSPKGEGAGLFWYQQPYLDGDYLTRYKDAKSDPQDSRALYVAMIKRAKRQLVLYVPYLSPPDDVLAAIQETARRGVRVIVFTNSYHVNDLAKPLAGAATSFYKPLLRAGVEIHEFWHRTLHAKAMMVDHTTAVMGSHNLTSRTFKSRGEASILTGDAAVIARFQEGVDRDIARETKQVTLDNLAEMRPDMKNGFMNTLGRMLRDFI